MRPPFSWLCHQEPLPWLGDQIDGSVIPLHAHGPNKLAHDGTSHPPTSTLSFDLSYGSPFLTEKSFIAFSRIPGRSISKVLFWILTFASYFHPLGLQPLLPTRQGTTLPSVANPMPEPRQREMRGIMMESGKYGGNGQWPFIDPPSGNSS